MSRLPPKSRLLVALDTPDLERATRLVSDLRGEVGGIKIGKEFFTAQGPAGVRSLGDALPLFLDLKFHDIPNTVAGALRASLRLAPLLLNVHASGGRVMMRAAALALREEADRLEVAPPKLLAVTVLTSLDAGDLAELGLPAPAEQVRRLALLAQDCGLDGVVCSPLEIAALRNACGPDFLLVVPGIRPAWATAGDQKRVMTPAEAVTAGADYIVVGRPITGAEKPAAAAAAVVAELAAGEVPSP